MCRKIIFINIIVILLSFSCATNMKNIPISNQVILDINKIKYPFYAPNLWTPTENDTREALAIIKQYFFSPIPDNEIFVHHIPMIKLIFNECKVQFIGIDKKNKKIDCNFFFDPANDLKKWKEEYIIFETPLRRYSELREYNYYNWRIKVNLIEKETYF